MNLQLGLYFLVILNPFSQILFLGDLVSSMTWRHFAVVYARASLLSFGVYSLFALTGDFLFIDVFRVSIEAFRIFGGVIVLIIALRYFTEGYGSNQFFQGKVTDVASSISIPFMVGPATIWVSMLIGRNLPAFNAVIEISAVLFINYLGVIIAHRFLSRLDSLRDSLAGAYLTILMRTNALFIGAIGVEMILTGIGGMAARTTNQINQLAP